MIIDDGIIEEKIPVLIDGKSIEQETRFAFGMRLAWYIENELDMPLIELDKLFDSIKKDKGQKNITKRINLILDVVWCAHKAYCDINECEPVISKNKLWFTIDKAPGVLSDIFMDGFSNIKNKAETENPKKPIPA